MIAKADAAPRAFAKFFMVPYRDLGVVLLGVRQLNPWALYVTDISSDHISFHESMSIILCALEIKYFAIDFTVSDVHYGRSSPPRLRS